MEKLESGFAVASYSLTITLLRKLVKNGILTKSEAVELIEVSRLTIPNKTIFPGDASVLKIADQFLEDLKTMI